MKAARRVNDAVDYRILKYHNAGCVWTEKPSEQPHLSLGVECHLEGCLSPSVLVDARQEVNVKQPVVVCVKHALLK